MKSFRDLKIGLDEELDEKLQWLVPNYSQFRILRKSVDARRSTDPHWVYSVDVYEPGETPSEESFILDRVTVARSSARPVIVGSGPAGLFAALRLVERGIACVLLERGSQGPERIQKINRFWRYGELDPDNNVCFGEGGAGLYSDGKLITRIKSPFIAYVMNRLVRFGAPKEILYLANPHVGSDRIRRVIPKLREYLIENGCEIHFDTPMKSLILHGQSVTGVECKDGRVFHTDHVVVATGHSADDVLSGFQSLGVQMEGKSFAVGLRIEHLQKQINQIQFRSHAGDSRLGAANYRLADHDSKTGIGVYSFCMCPGGFVLSSGTSAGGVVVNGMSNYNRGSPFANSAVVVSIDHAARFGSDLFAGLRFRTQLERSAHLAVVKAGGRREIPVQNMVDFLAGKDGEALKSSSPSGVVSARLDRILPVDLVEALRGGLENFDRNMRGFVTRQAQFHGVESRTSCPVRVTRHSETLQSLSHRGLYPCGEGAGYAGGITSAAVDGIRVAEAIACQLAAQTVQA